MGRQSRRRRRAGAAAVELAATLPLLVIVFFGVVDLCNLIRYQESLSIASYEGARLAAKAANGDVKNDIQSVLNSRSIKDAEINISPAEYRNAAPGELISVSIQAPRAGAGGTFNRLMNGTYQSKTTFVKE